jgi:hypothetical protein
MIGSRFESGTSLCLVVLPMAFVFSFAEGARISGELSLLTSGFRTMIFFAGGGGGSCSTEGVALFRAVRALVVLVMTGIVGCALTRVEALEAAAGFPDMVFSTYKVGNRGNTLDHMTAFGPRDAVLCTRRVCLYHFTL